MGDINPTTKRSYTDYYLLEESPTDYEFRGRFSHRLHRYGKFNKEHKQSVRISEKSMGDINPTTKRSYTDYYLLEITFHRLYRFTQIFKAYNIIYTDF